MERQKGFKVLLIKVFCTHLFITTPVVRIQPGVGYIWRIYTVYTVYTPSHIKGRATNFEAGQDGRERTGDTFLVFFRTGDTFLVFF